MQNKITYLGHSSFLFESTDATVLFDPSANEMIENTPRDLKFAYEPDMAKNIDLILITHEHSGHCDPATVKRIVERTNASVVAPANVLEKIDISPRLKVEIKVGETFKLRGASVKVVKAVHPQSQYPVGYIVTAGGMSVYHAGDTYVYPGIEANTATVALLPAGGTYTMDDADAAMTAKNLKAKYAIPMHYGTHAKVSSDIEMFTKNIGENVKPVVLRPGQAVKFN
ncbi:MAG: MBL fold metallo-hydrolase [Candidatus Micrarchaeia archaeon]